MSGFEHAKPDILVQGDQPTKRMPKEDCSAV